VFVTVGLMLLSIPGVRELGLTLMASAGSPGLPSAPPRSRAQVVDRRAADGADRADQHRRPAW
jgi:hypothetical protein